MSVWKQYSLDCNEWRCWDIERSGGVSVWCFVLKSKACAWVQEEKRNTDDMLCVALFNNCVVADAVTYSPSKSCIRFTERDSLFFSECVCGNMWNNCVTIKVFMTISAKVFGTLCTLGFFYINVMVFAWQQP